MSDLRQLNRLVLNKEAAVREVHHRVKNNLQTISSLLRLQARRSDEPETRIALQEAERRVRSIAVVHEVLSREPGEEVVFDEIVRSLVLLVEDTVLALHPVEIVVNGELGTLSTDLATPLAVALAELLDQRRRARVHRLRRDRQRARGRGDAEPLPRRRRRRRRDPRQRSRTRRRLLPGGPDEPGSLDRARPHARATATERSR